MTIYCLRAGAGAQPPNRQGDGRRRLRHLQPWLPLDRALQARPRGEALADPPGDPLAEEDLRRAPAGVVLPLRAERPDASWWRRREGSCATPTRTTTTCPTGRVNGKPPYSPDANDARCCIARFYTYCRDTFDVLFAEGKRAPKIPGAHDAPLGSVDRSASASTSHGTGSRIIRHRRMVR